MTPLLQVRDLSVRFGSVDAVRDVSIEVNAGSIVGLIGPNGAGKTSLLDALTGIGPTSSGQVVFAGRSIGQMPPHHRARQGMTRTFQSLELFEDLTVAENLAVAAESSRSGREQVAARVERAATLTGLTGILGRHPVGISHALRKRVALGRALAGEPSLVLLDEPAGGLDEAERTALARTLRTVAGEGTAVVLVDHDMGLVLEVCEEVCVLDLGRVVARGTPSAVRADPALAAAYLGMEDEMDVSTRPTASPATSPRNPVVRVEHLSSGYADVPVLHDVSLDVRAGEVVALLGANGAGKTTTLLAVSGLLPANQGSVSVLGRSVHGRPHDVARSGLAHVPQDRGVLPALTVAENLKLASRFANEGVDDALHALPALSPLLARRAGNLSGGEQQLLAIGRALAARPKAVLVDELSLGLAASTLRDVLAALRSLADDGVGVLMVEQHPDLALRVADRAYVLQRGQVVLEGSAREVAARKEALEEAYLG
ncbi:MAG TPA: ATP-binding cassette domain-containing protein [Acidimicrobiales bacterium]|nr:ATP-binding cassette domain-containing protein [Acidimicrobiales bacterium]